MRPILAGAAGLRPLAAALAFVAAIVCLAPPAAAIDRYWIDGSGQWDVSENWDPVGQPEAGDTVYLTQSDATDRVVTYSNTLNPDAVLDSLTINATGLGTMTLDMPNDHALSVTTEYVGYDGKGAVTESAGTHTVKGPLYLGYHPTGEGTYSLTGGTLDAEPMVGYAGTGTFNVQAGGQVVSYSGYLGCEPGSTGVATVTGAGSAWTISEELGQFIVGSEGTGTLTIQDGGTVSSTGIMNGMGFETGSTGVATVSGTHSTWTDGSIFFYVGRFGTGTLTIEAGGEVSSALGFIGRWPGSSGTVIVTGAGSTWTVGNRLYVGSFGAGTLTVSDGGLVSAITLLASWSDLYGDGMIATHGAVLDADLVFDSTHGLMQAMLFGTGGTLNLDVDGTGYLGVGYKTAGTLRIADGLTVASTSGVLGSGSGSTGIATVTGEGSTWTLRDLHVGDAGAGTLTIEAGGQVSSSSGYLGFLSGSTGTATVDGIGSVWNNTNSLYVGGSSSAAGGTGSVTVKNGGRLTVAGTLKVWSAGSLTIQSGGGVTAGSLDLAPGGRIDVAAGNLIVDYDGSSPLAAVRAMLASGCAGGLWNGPGITSSLAAADAGLLTAVGVIDNTDPKVGGKTTFEGEAVDATAVLVKYTWWGDANLDGVVDANDYDVIDKMYLFPPAAETMGWWTGDFNYDGLIDANDYDRIDKAYLFQTGPLAAGDAVAPAAAPEPATLALLGLGALAAAVARCRRR